MTEAPIEKASWIWCNTTPEEPNQYGCFRRTFELAARPDAAVIQCCADMRYWVYVNGTRVGFGPAKYHLPEPRYDTHDVAAFLKPGRNVVVFKVHGMGTGHRCSSFMPFRCGLIAAVWAKTGDGAVELVTDAEWKACRETAYAVDTPRFAAHQSFIECFDARRAVEGWRDPDLDDASWAQAVVLGKTADLPPWERLLPRAVPLLTLDARVPAHVIESGRLIPRAEHDYDSMQTLADMLQEAERLPADVVLPATPQRMFPMHFRPAEGETAYALFDFAENSAGYLRLRMRGEPGTIVDMAYSESIARGELEANKQGVRYADRLILGDSPLDHQLMLPKTLRYLLVAVRGKAVLDALEHDVSTYPVEWKGCFYSSDPVLDAAWRIGAHTIAISMEDVYMDTPRRERAGWLGDMRPEALGAYYAFGDYACARNSLDMFMASQDAPGLYVERDTSHPGGIISRYPSIDGGRMPDYSASVAMIVLEYVMHSGDLDFAAEHWDGIKKVTGHNESFRTAENLITYDQTDAQCGGGYILIDWAPFDRRGCVAGHNMLYLGYLRAAAGLAHLLGDASEAERCDELHARTLAAVRKLFWDDTRGLFVNCRYDGHLSARAGYQENLLALLCDVPNPEQYEALMNGIFATDDALPIWDPHPPVSLWPILRQGKTPEWDDAELVPVGSPYFTFFALWALFEGGRGRAALETLRGQYGRILSHGATSVWEEWDGAKSLSHGWGGGICALMLQYIVGVQPMEPGYRRFSILPTYADLRRARGRVPTPCGTIAAEWEREDGETRLAVSIPDDTAALVGLPADAGGSGLLVDGAETEGERLERKRGAYAAVTLGPGEHELRSAQV